MARREEVLEITRQIFETEAKLAKLRDRFAALVPDDAPAKPTSGATKGSPTARILDFMGEHSGKILQVSQISKGLPDIEKKLLRNIVYRLGKTGRLEVHNRGEYSLSPRVSSESEKMRSPS